MAFRAIYAGAMKALVCTLALVTGCWLTSEPVVGHQRLYVDGQILDGAGQPAQDVSVAVSIDTPATDDHLDQLLIRPEYEMVEGQALARRADGAFQAAVQYGTYPATLDSFGHVGPDPAPVPDEIQSVFLYVRSGEQWLSLEIPVQSAWQQDAADGDRAVVLPDVQLSSGHLSLAGSQSTPLLRDLSDFSAFQVKFVPGWRSEPGTGKIGEAGIVRTKEGRYHLRMSVYQFFEGEVWLPERDLTDEEVTRMLSIFSHVHLRIGETSVPTDIAGYYRYSWDDTVFSDIPEVNPDRIGVEAVSLTQIANLLEDLQAHATGH